MDRLVEIARFQDPTTGQMVENMLQTEQIECVLHNAYTTLIFGGYADVGGTRIEVMEKDVAKALKVLTDCGYADYISYEEN